MPDEFSAQLDGLHHSTFEYFWSGNHPESGLPKDRMRSNGLPLHETTSISGVGFGFLALIVGAYRSWITRQEAVDRANRMLRSLGAVKRFHGAFPHFVHTSALASFPVQYTLRAVLSVFIDGKKLSIAALSQTFPERLIEQVSRGRP